MPKSLPPYSPYKVTLEYDGAWSKNVPGKDVTRIEFLSLLTRGHDAAKRMDRENRNDIMREVAAHNILTIGQLAQVFCLTRQRMYILLLQDGIDKAAKDERVQGKLNGRALDHMLLCVKALHRSGTAGLTPVLLDRLPQCGWRSIVDHLVGIDYASYAPLRPYQERKVMVRLS